MFEGQSVSSEEVVLLMAVAGEATAVVTVGRWIRQGGRRWKALSGTELFRFLEPHVCVLTNRSHGFYKSTQTIL